jgi:hypothetical protein
MPGPDLPPGSIGDMDCPGPPGWDRKVPDVLFFIYPSSSFILYPFPFINSFLPQNSQQGKFSGMFIRR